MKCDRCKTEIDHITGFSSRADETLCLPCWQDEVISDNEQDREEGC